MKASIRTQWLAALRSGQYKQNQNGHLRVGDTYCCLGVLCELASPGCWEPTAEFNAGIQYRPYIKCDDHSRVHSSCSLPSRTLMEMLGFTVPDIDCAANVRTAPFQVVSNHPIWDKLLTHPAIRVSGLGQVNAWRDAGYVELTALNDAGLTFKEIADIIEEFIPADPESQPAAEVAASTDGK